MKIAIDTNGNKIVKIEREDFGVGRGFSIQTNGNLSYTHLFDVGSLDNIDTEELEMIKQEILLFVVEYGSEAQQDKVLGADQK